MSIVDAQQSQRMQPIQSFELAECEKTFDLATRSILVGQGERNDILERDRLAHELQVRSGHALKIESVSIVRVAYEIQSLARVA